MVEGGSTTDTSYFMDVYLNENDTIKEVRQTVIPPLHVPCYGSFTISYQDRMIRGGGRDEDDKVLDEVREFDDAIGWRKLPDMIIPRSFAGACTLRNKIIVGGGIDSNYKSIDSLEMLRISTSNNSPMWTRIESSLPNSNLCSPILSPLLGKIILIEGKLNRRGTYQEDAINVIYEEDSVGGPYQEDSIGNAASAQRNRVWEGTLQSNNGIEWKKVQSLRYSRFDCFSVVVDQKMYVFGGVPDGLDRIEVFDGREWKMGPMLVTKLSTKNAQAVVDNRKRIIITTNYNGIIVYNTENGIIKICDEYSLDKKRLWYSASTH